MRATPLVRLQAAGAMIAATALLLAGCGGTASGSNANGDTKDKDTVSFALPAGTTPDWILPLASPDKMTTPDHAIKSVMWPALLEYDGTSGTMTWDKAASAAKSVEFNADNTQATITLNDLTWSDGVPMTSRDVEFWFNLAKANNTKMGGYSAGLMPDNVTNFQTVNDKTFTLTFDHAYNQDFMMANQLSLIYPMPQHVWDKESTNGPVGDYDRNPADAQKVFDYLFSQAQDTKTYDTNPLWDVVAGPYKLESWSNSGEVKLTANDKYTGTDKPHIKNVDLMPFTTTDAEMNAVRSGDVDYGYITPSQLPTKDQYTSLGYDIKQWDGWSVTYMPYNFANPTMGPVFSQLYVRQGLQSAIDQKTISSKVWQGAATPDYGPIPQQPDNKYLSPEQKANPYPYDLDKAEKYFTDNGWTKGSDGLLACTNPGTGPGQCGAGIAAGTEMKIDVLTQSGSQETDNMMATIKSSLSKIGVQMTIDSEPLDSVLTDVQKCKAGSDCSWQLAFFGAAGSWYFSAYPTGERIFATDTQWNCGQYNNPTSQNLINEMTTSSDPTIAQQYSKQLAQDLPVMWMPNPSYQVSAIKTGLDIGGTQDPGGSFYPQRWSWK